MNDNKVTLIGILFFLFCASLIGGIYYLDTRLVELQGQYDELEQRRVDLNQTTKSLVDQKKIFSEAFTSLESYKVNVAPDDMAFYSGVQQVVQASGIDILSTRQMGASKDGRSSIVLTLKGNYYSFMRVLADWRNLPLTVRVSNMGVTASKNQNLQTQGEVQADVTLEAIVSNKK